MSSNARKTWQPVLTVARPGVSQSYAGVTRFEAPANLGAAASCGLLRRSSESGRFGTGWTAVAQRPSTQRPNAQCIQEPLGRHESVHAEMAKNGRRVLAMAELSLPGDVSGPYPWRQPD